MAAPSLAPSFDSASRRHVARNPVTVPVDVVTLKSGIPNTMPGRCTDLSEGGLGVVVAGRLIPGQSVALELRLPNVGLPIRARAQVRYQNDLHYGLQFLGLSMEQREMIRYWSSQIAEPLPATLPQPQKQAEPVPLPALQPAPDKSRRTRRIRVRRRRFFLLVALMLMLAGFGWWQWQQSWNRLERASSTENDNAAIPVRVPSETMDARLLYKVDPVYPEAARAAGTQGLVVLDARIAPDGSVSRLRPITGPDLLTQAALAAVQSWKYLPYRQDGQAVDVETTISVDFRLR